ncbi:hypothetical protein PSI19_16275 [Xenorhabdus khoisanae]|uniref:hypothetical protein n=1 Tax=Xenorhabdus khoisanae TaxID=880157 RepID=UPI00235824CD|nr:hypothetical protein [Xenorhabdus khoisanae]MDC9615394.1 hypothetical protein [Xenorhabdus khoisanae]
MKIDSIRKRNEFCNGLEYAIYDKLKSFGVNEIYINIVYNSHISLGYVITASLSYQIELRKVEFVLTFNDFSFTAKQKNKINIDPVKKLASRREKYVFGSPLLEMPIPHLASIIVKYLDLPDEKIEFDKEIEHTVNNEKKDLSNLVTESWQGGSPRVTVNKRDGEVVVKLLRESTLIKSSKRLLTGQCETLAKKVLTFPADEKIETILEAALSLSREAGDCWVWDTTGIGLEKLYKTKFSECK